MDDLSPKTLLKPRRADTHKGDYGKLLLVCGSLEMPGAATLSAKAALRSGVGLCTICCERELMPVLSPAVPEAVFLFPDGSDALADAVHTSSAVLVGCGLGRSERASQWLDTVLRAAWCPVVVDADGLNMLCGRIDCIKTTNSVILTPHIGEMSRLTGLAAGTIKAQRKRVAQQFAVTHHVTVVLKDHVTVVAAPDGRLFENDRLGNPGMAKAGSGDTLSGILCALCAGGLPPFEAAAAAVQLHAMAGDRAAARLSQTAMLPTDMADCLCEVFSELGL